MKVPLACCFLASLGCSGGKSLESSVDAALDAASCERTPASAFLHCTCADTPADPGPGSFGCTVPRIVYNRVCLVDASCNAYPYVPDAPDPLAATTMRHDVAIRWEWAEPIPLEANVGLNQAPRGYPTAFSPLGLFAVANPTLDDLPVSIDSTRAIAGEVAIDADRMAIAIAPQDCLAGHWAVEASINLGTMYGGPVCGEEPGTQVGYGATFVLR